jgi:ArsR family metal-binding transcriptional regulator
MDDLINSYQTKIVESGCAPVSGRYGLQVDTPDDISPVFPYLNALLTETRYDHQNKILIWREPDQACALRPHEIKIAQAGGISSPAEARELADKIVARLNGVWRDREKITPSFKEKARPAVTDIFQLLPRTNCKECGYLTCLVYAAELREGKTGLENCPHLANPEYTANRQKLAQMI